jgi:capsular polysaccharide biosynthesis protein
MNEISILQILYKNRFRLLVVPVALGVVVGLLSLLSSNRYSSTAAISVQRPEVPITGEISPLQVEALRSLADSTRVKKELFDSLREEGELEDRIDFRRFQRLLSTQVQHVEGRERTLLPIVKLTAATPDPALSMEIANRWAEVVLDQTRKIYQSGVGELSEFTAAMYEEVNKSLRESEERYAGVRLETNLEENQRALKHNRELYSRLLGRSLDLKDQAATGEARLGQLEARVAEQEIEGIWIGDHFTPDDELDGDFGLSTSTPLIRRILSTLQSLGRNEEALAEFEKTSRLEQKEARIKVLKVQIDEITREILQARVKLSSVEPNYRKLTEELVDLNPTINLKKALGDEMLMVLPESGRKGEDFPKLESEISNPIYEEIKAEVVRLSGQVDGLRNKIEEGDERLGELRTEIADLSREIASLSARKRVFQAAIDRDRELLDYYALSYREDRRRFEEVKKELEQAAAELTATEDLLAEAASSISQLEEKVYAGENTIARMKRDVDNLSNVRSSLASRAEEVKLLQVSMENVSRSGTVLLYGAEMDPDKVGPNRLRIVLISIFLGFLVYSLVLVLREAVDQADNQSPAAAA